MKITNKQNGTALIMGMMISMLILFVALSVSKSTIHALSSGTDIADWEFAHQAAETAVENATLSLNKVVQDSGIDALKNNSYMGNPVAGPGTSPSNFSLNFNRRDMDQVWTELNTDPQIVNRLLTDAYNPTIDQYWNYKLWIPVAVPIGQTVCPPNGNPTYNANCLESFGNINFSSNVNPPVYNYIIDAVGYYGGIYCKIRQLYHIDSITNQISYYRIPFK